MSSSRLHSELIDSSFEVFLKRAIKLYSTAVKEASTSRCIINSGHSQAFHFKGFSTSFKLSLRSLRCQVLWKEVFFNNRKNHSNIFLGEVHHNFDQGFFSSKGIQRARICLTWVQTKRFEFARVRICGEGSFLRIINVMKLQSYNKIKSLGRVVKW